MSVNEVNKSQKPGLLNDLTFEESEKLRGGSFSDPPYPWLPAEYGLKVEGKCNVDEIIGPDGQCYKYYTKSTSTKITI